MTKLKATTDGDSLVETQTQNSTQSKFPYLERLARLAGSDHSYQNASELRNMAMMDDAQGEAYLQSPPRSRWDCFILDYDSTSLAAKSFTQGSHKEEDSFCAALRDIPAGTETRVIILQPSHFPAILSPRVVETLGQMYDVDPRLYGRMLKSEPGQLRGRELGIPDREPDLPLSSNFLSLGYRYRPENLDAYLFPTSPQVWAQVIECSQATERSYNLVLVYLYPAYKQGDVIRNHHRAIVEQENYSYLIDVGTLTQWTDPVYRAANPQMAHCLDYFHNSDTARIHSANKNPMEYLTPFFELLEAHCHHVTQSLRITHRYNAEYSQIPQSTRDQLLFTAWKDARGHIEDFQSIMCRIEAYQDILASQPNVKAHSSKSMDMVFRKQKRLLEKARNTEQHIRDTIQLNVGNLSLQESRKSLQQADTIGRVSILAFIFLPLSLVTSFFGMNVQQLTGAGATWQAIVITASALCILVLYICVWMWRKSFPILAARIYSPVIIVLVVVQLPMIIYYIAIHIGHKINKRAYLGLTLRSSLQRGLQANPAGPFIQEWRSLSETIDEG